MQFLFIYPVIMTVVYLVGLLMFYIFIETSHQPIVSKNVDEGITFLIPCFNEEFTIEQTIKSIHDLSFPHKEIIVINDGSTDRTLEVIKNLKSMYTFKIINFEENRGKANALNKALTHASYDYVMCVDADTVIDDDAPYYMLEHFRATENVGAVTGNPRIRNKDTLIERIQVLEYASIIGSIKKQQTLNGYINTVSGVFVLFKKEAIQAVGGWDVDMITEDIAISWKLHLNDYQIVYEPRALCRMIVPNTLSGLWKQRLRWAQGGQEVLWRDGWQVIKSGKIPYILLLIEQVVSLGWSTGVVGLILFNFIELLIYRESFEDINLLFLSTFILLMLNITFFAVSLLIDSRYEPINLIYILFLPWYPFFYWLLNAFVSIIAIPKSLTRKKGAYATWTSPDR